MSIMRTIAIAVLLIANSGCSSFAQAGPLGDRCGVMSVSRGAVERLSRYFTEDEYAGLRGDAIEQLPVTVSKSEVTNRGVCTRALNAALRILEQDPRFIEASRRGYMHKVFQIGPYYAVLVRVNDLPGQVSLAPVPLIVLSGPAMRFVSIIAT